jgi:preprotein translocase subunit SecY
VIVLKNLKNVFSIKELRGKILFTLGILIVSQLGTYIPIPGIDLTKLNSFIGEGGILSNIFKYIDTFTGSAIGKCMLFSLGIMPYISASLMMQMLGMSVPSLEALLKEGEYGRKVFNQYTRYLALALATLYSILYTITVETKGVALFPGWNFRIFSVLSLIAGSMFVIWLADQISLRGIGNGSSMIIFAGIVSRLIPDIMKTQDAVNSGSINYLDSLIILSVYLLIIAFVVFLEKGERKVPVQYARRVIGNKIMGGQSAFIPFKLNAVGIMPVIFASIFLQAPVFLSNLLASKFVSFKILADWFVPTGALYLVTQFVLIVYCTFFYADAMFNPEELAGNLKKDGGFVPGIRPGKQTAQFFEKVLNRLWLVGSFYLGLLATIPNILLIFIPRMPFFLGGTSLLIVVGVALELATQIESYLMEHNYDSLLITSKSKRVAR